MKKLLLVIRLALLSTSVCRIEGMYEIAQKLLTKPPTVLRTLKGHGADSKKVVTTSVDKTAKIWDAQTGKLLHTLTGHTNLVVSAACSPTGKNIVTASYDNTAKVWDTQTGKLLHTLTGHTGHVEAVAFSPDGSTVVTTSSDDTVKLWDLRTILVGGYFSDKTVPVKQQAVLVTLDTLSHENKGVPIIQEDIPEIAYELRSLPTAIRNALRHLYTIQKTT